ncbi:unnamed protein product [Ixodes pacificus]
MLLFGRERAETFFGQRTPQNVYIFRILNSIFWGGAFVSTSSRTSFFWRSCMKCTNGERLLINGY